MAELQTLVIEGGCTFREEYVWMQPVTAGSSTLVPVDLTGYTARMMIKLGYDDAAPLQSLTSSPAAGITITAAEGLVTVELTPTQTAQIEAAMVAALAASTISELRAITDLELVSGDRVYRMFEGEVVLRREVTK